MSNLIAPCLLPIFLDVKCTCLYVFAALHTEYVTQIKKAYLICLVVSHSEGERLRQVAGGQLGGIIIWRSTTRCAVVGNWDLGKRIYLL